MEQEWVGREERGWTPDPGPGSARVDDTTGTADGDHSRHHDSGADNEGQRPLVPLHTATEGLAAAAGTFAASSDRKVLVAATDDDLTTGLTVIDKTRATLDAAAVSLVREAVTTRGLPKDEGFNAHDWLALRVPGLSRADRCAIVAVASAMEHPDPDTRAAHQVLEGPIGSGALRLHQARRLLRCLDCLRPHVDRHKYAEDLGILLPLAIKGTEKDLTTATTAMLALALPEQADEAEKHAYEARGVDEHTISSTQLGIDLYELTVRCDRHGAELFRAVFASPLAAPTPDPETGEADPRRAAQRRYDALITILSRAMTNPTGTPTTTKATVLVTMTLDQLVGDCDLPATTATGGLLTAGAARRMACDAGHIPAVLGTDSIPLDLGRTARFASPAQVKALTLRDGGCTWPGCTTPAGWCEAHHLQWWTRDQGPTDLANEALLCPRHHTHVHTHHIAHRRAGPDEIDPTTRRRRHIIWLV